MKSESTGKNILSLNFQYYQIN